VRMYGPSFSVNHFGAGRANDFRVRLNPVRCTRPSGKLGPFPAAKHTVAAAAANDATAIALATYAEVQVSFLARSFFLD